MFVYVVMLMAKAKLSAQNNWNCPTPRWLGQEVMERGMGPAVFVIAILGCGEAEGSCQQVSVAPAQYSSFAACTRATDAALARSEDVDFPVVVAQCKAAGAPASLQIDPSDIKLPEAAPAREPGRILRTNYRQPATQRG